MQKLVNYIMQSMVILLPCWLIIGCATRVIPAQIINVTSPPSSAIGTNGVSPKVLTVNNISASPIVNNSDTPVLGSIEANSPVLSSGAANPATGLPSTNIVSVTPVRAAPISTASDLKGNNKNTSDKEWIMPISGEVVGRFSVAAKGVDFKASVGQPIYVINDGKVLYSGNGLAAYGNLIIVRHANGYLSAYARNKENLVKEGFIVKRGQKIATVGMGKDNIPILHFEVRKNGKPIDPFTIIK